MRLRPDRRDDPELNLTPLIDVVFLLLIFFMVSTTFERTSELAIELPRSSNETRPKQDDPIEISVDAQGRFYINGKRLVNTQTKTLLEALRKARAGREEPAVVVNADAAAPMQAGITIMDAVRRLGLAKLSFAAQRQAERE